MSLYVTDYRFPPSHVRRIRRSLCLALPLTAFAAGCGADATPSVTPERDGSAAVLAVTPLAESSPIRAAGAVRAYDGKGMDGLAEALRGVDAVAADLAAGDVEGLKPVVDLALARRVPLILEGVREASTLARLVGFGVPGEVVLVTPRGRNTLSLTVLEEARGELTTSDEGTVTPAEGGAAEALAASLGRLRAAREHDGELGATAQALTSDTEVHGVMYQYYVDLPELRWKPRSDKSQTALMDSDYVVSLYAAGNVNKKYVSVRPAGAGMHPGSLEWDNDEDRGYFLDNVEIEVEPQLGGLSSERHAPTTTNRENSFTSTTGFDFGAGVSKDGPSTSASFNYSEAATTSFTDFGATDQTYGKKTAWRFEMTGASGHSYSSWGDLVDKWTGFLHGLPGLSKSNFTPQYEAMYRAEGDFQSVVPIRLMQRQTLRNTWVDWKVVVAESHTRTSTMTRTSTCAVDMSLVNVPRAGTLPYHEPWTSSSISSGYWIPVNEGTTGAATWSVVPGQWAQLTGAAGTTDNRRGAYLLAKDTYFGEGNLVGRVWAGVGAAWGFMYSVQDANNFYRAEVSAREGKARIVKVTNGAYKVLAEAPASPRAGTWQDWRVERSGVAHRLYLGATPVVSAIDTEAPFASGHIALYGTGMNDVAFAATDITYPGERPAAYNVARGKPTSQSSTGYEGAPSRAVDGNVYGAWEGGSVTHTNNDAGAFWRVDLGGMGPLDAVTLWNRTDCCSERLANVVVEALNTEGGVVRSVSLPGVLPMRSEVPLGGVSAAAIRVRLRDGGFLSLAEVQVWRTPE